MNSIKEHYQLGLAMIHPGLKNGMIQAYTITVANQTFFLSHNEVTGKIMWNMFMDSERRQQVEEIFKDYLTKQNKVLYY